MFSQPFSVERRTNRSLTGLAKQLCILQAHIERLVLGFPEILMELIQQS